jgi:hypothetical protein
MAELSEVILISLTFKKQYVLALKRNQKYAISSLIKTNKLVGDLSY